MRPFAAPKLLRLPSLRLKKLLLHAVRPENVFAVDPQKAKVMQEVQRAAPDWNALVGARLERLADEERRLKRLGDPTRVPHGTPR